MQSGCACRGAAGLAHVGCRARAARVLEENKGRKMWWECQTCLQVFTGGMSVGLADAWWSEVRDRAEEDVERLAASNNLATSLAARGTWAEAEQMQRKAHELVHKQVLGTEHRYTLVAAGNLAAYHSAQQKYAEAEQVQREELEALTRVLEEEHAGTLSTASNLAASPSAQGMYTEAEQMQHEVHAAQTRVLVAEHRDTLRTAGNLAASLYRQGKLEEVERMFREGHEAQTRHSTPTR